MAETTCGQVTSLLRAVHAGRPGAVQDLMQLIYSQLRQMAQAQVRRTPMRAAPQPTALVHEAYLRLFGKSETTWEDRRHFFWAAARAMRDILVEEARRNSAQKRGGESRRVDFPDDVALQDESHQLIELSGALDRLAIDAPEAASVVMLRFFGGLNHKEVADVLGCSEPTVRRRWAFARAWLHKELAVDLAAPACISDME